MTRPTRSLLVVASLCVLAGLASADLIHLKDGRTIEGTVIEKTAQKVVVKTKFGTSEFAAADVERIEEKERPEDAFKRKRAEIDAKDAEALFDLYLWARENGLKSQPKAVLRDILKVDPDHAQARQLLGYVQHAGEWMTEEERDKRIAAEDVREKERQGLVRHKGQWMTPEEKEEAEHLERGDVLVDGQWVKKSEVDKLQREKEAAERRANGEFLVDGKWLPKEEANQRFTNLATPYLAVGDHVILHTNKGPDCIEFGDKRLVTAEAAYRKAKDFFGVEPEMDGRKLHVFVAASLDDYKQLGNDMGGDEKSSNFYAFATQWLPNTEGDEVDLATVTMYNLEESLTDLYVTHATIEQYVRRLVGPEAKDPPPRWFIDAVASYLERWQNPKFFSWTRDRLRAVGWMLKYKTFFGSYPVTEQSVLQGGLTIAYLQSDAATPEQKQLLADVIEAVKSGGKTQKAFRALEKELMKADDAVDAFGQQ